MIEIIETRTCPFCGANFKMGWDPETTITYDICHIGIGKLSEDSFKNKESFICQICYDKLTGDIEVMERRMKNEQPKIP